MKNNPFVYSFLKNFVTLVILIALINKELGPAKSVMEKIRRKN